MTALVSDYLRRVAYALLILSLVPGVLVIVSLHKARRAPYYVIRRAALKQAQRLMLVILGLFVVVVILLAVPPRLTAVLPATPTVTPVPTSVPTIAPSPSPTPTATPTRGPTATAPAIPTATSEIPPPASALTPLPLAVPAREDARVQVQYLALGRDEDGQPVDPAGEFPPGRNEVHLFFQYADVDNGVATTFAWYKQGQLLEGCSDTWLWGSVEGREWGESGFAWYSCNPAEGWEPGTYEIRVFLETRLQGIAQFLITEQ